MIQADKIRARDGDGLALYEDGGAGIFVQNGGNVGIRTVNPITEFEVVGDPTITNTVHSNGTAIFFRNTTDNISAAIGGLIGEGGVLKGGIDFYVNGNSSFVGLTEAMRIQSDGKVGIGISAPTATLVVQKDQNDITAMYVNNHIALGNSSARANITVEAVDASGGIFVYPSDYINPIFADKFVVVANSDASGMIIKTTAATANIEIQRVGSDVTAVFDYNGNVGIGTITPSAKLAINGGLHVGGDSDPGDNNLTVDGTTTTDKLVVTTPTGYGEMYMYDNATPCVIDVADVYHAVYNTFGNNDGVLAPIIDTTHFTYKLGLGYVIASVADYNAPTSTQIKVTITAGHALLAGEPVTLTGTTDYDGTYLVLATGLTATEFVVTKTYTQTRTGSVRRPATLKCLVAGKYRAVFTISGVCANPNDNF
jgi:hypothetical protein